MPEYVGGDHIYDPDHLEKMKEASLKVRASKRRKSQQTFLVSFGQDFDIDRACHAAGIARGTYSSWRAAYPEFKEAVDNLRKEAAHNTNAPDPERVWTLSVEDFVYWRARYLGFDTPDFQRLMVEAFITMATAELKGQITLILVPPEHGKSTLLEDYVTFLLCIDPQRTITIISERSRQAIKMSTRIKSRLETNGPTPDIPQMFGPFAPVGKESTQAWGNEFWSVAKKKAHDERDYSVATGGWKGAIAGTRTTDLLVDDIMSLKNLTQARDVLEVFRQDMLSRPGVNGNTTVVGTRVGDDDFYEELLKTGIVDHVIEFPAIGEDGTSLWPERYSLTDYKRLRRNVGESAWWRNYQQRPQRAGSATFDEVTLERMCNTFMHKEDPLEAGRPLYISCDPAFGGHCVVTCCQHTSTGLRVVDMISEEGLARTEQIIQMIHGMIIGHSDHARNIFVSDLVIESNAAQKGLANDDRILELADKYGFMVVDHQTGWNKIDENIGIPQMANSAKRGEIIIPYADDGHTSAQFEWLVHELKRWRPRVRGTKLRQDKVMSLWFCWILFRQRTQWDDVENDDWSYQAPGRTGGLFAGLGAQLT